jgi:nicotinamidase-related amidase
MTKYLSHCIKTITKPVKTIDIKDSLLVVIDMQNDFIHPAGTLCLNRDNEELRLYTIKNAIAIINLFKRNECPVLAIRDTHTKNSPELNTLPDHCILYSWGYQIYEDIDNAIKQADHVYGYKNSFDGSKTILHHLSELRPIKKIFLIGVAYDICVFFTAAGLTKGWPAEDIHIIRNATMDFNNHWAKMTTEMLNTLYNIQPVTLSIINSM